MTRLPRIFGLFALVLALVAGACGNNLSDTVRPPAATVNDTNISQAELDEELQAIRSNDDYLQSIESQGLAVTGDGDGTLANGFVGRVLTRQIFLRLVADELQKRDLEVGEDELEAATAGVHQSVGGPEIFEQFPAPYRQTLLRRNAQVAKLQAELSGNTVTDEAVATFYAENLAQFQETCVRHILFAVETDGQLDQEATTSQIERLTADAAAAKAEIAAGADFNAVAAARSIDRSNANEGGNLDCGPAGRFVPEFETVMDALEVGAVSDPVATQFGVHLIKVDERRPVSLEEAEPQIRQQLEGEGQQAFSQFLQEAVEDAEIRVNPRYGRFSLDGQAPGVIPPSAPTTTVPGDGPTTAIPSPLPLQP